MTDYIHRLPHVPHRQDCKTSEPLRPARLELGGVFITAARKRAALARITELHPRLGHRDERHLDGIGVHHIECRLRRPVRITSDGWTATGLIDGVPVELRDEMEVEIDAARWRHVILYGQNRLPRS